MSTQEEKEAALAAYNDVVASAELLSINLVASHFFVKPEYYSFVSRDEAAETLKKSFGSEFSAFYFDAERNLAGAQFDWSIEATLSRKKVLSLKSTFVISYEKVPAVGNAHIEAYVKRVGRFATYPYFRGTVSHMSWNSDADLPMMPVLR